MMGVAFVLIMGVFIKCCAVHTPSSNPKKPPALSITQTLRHPYSTLRRKRHHHPQQPAPSAPYIAAPNPASSGPPHNHGEGRNHYSRPKGNKSCWNFPFFKMSTFHFDYITPSQSRRSIYFLFGFFQPATLPCLDKVN